MGKKNQKLKEWFKRIKIKVREKKSKVLLIGAIILSVVSATRSNHQNQVIRTVYMKITGSNISHIDINRSYCDAINSFKGLKQSLKSRNLQLNCSEDRFLDLAYNPSTKDFGNWPHASLALEGEARGLYHSLTCFDFKNQAFEPGWFSINGTD